MTDKRVYSFLNLPKLKAKQKYFLDRRVKFRNPMSQQKTFPAYSSIKKYCGEIYDQGEVGSCTANAFAMAYQVQTNIKNGNPILLSRLYYYYFERLAEGNAQTDSGGDEVDGLKVAQTKGVCLETSWPYDPTKVETCPSQSCIDEAVNYKITSFSVFQLHSNLFNNIKQSIIDKKPVLIAIGVYQSFESDEVEKTGVVPMPDPVNFEDSNDPKDPFVGGHEVLIVGYTDSKHMFTCVNSWGESWGDNGYFYLPYDYVINQNLTYEVVNFTL
jgi:C1A family cysteine protease